MKEASYIKRAWNYGDSVYASLNDILSKMKESGWTRAVNDDELIFSKDDISDDEENMTLPDLVANRSLLGNNTVRKDLSANDCDMSESDKLRDMKDIIDEGMDIEGKAEEDPSVAEGDSNSEMSKMKSDDHDMDKEVVASSEGSEKQDVTEEDVGGEHTVKDSVKGGMLICLPTATVIDLSLILWCL